MGSTFKKIRTLSRLKSDEDVHTFIREIRKQAGHELKYKLIADVMSQPGAPSQNIQWIASEAVKAISPQTKTRTPSDSTEGKIEYEKCPICLKQVEKGALTTHYLSLHHIDEAIQRLRLLNDNPELNLLYSMQTTYELPKHLSLSSIKLSLLPPPIKKRFQDIERTTVQWQQCFERIPYPPVLEELRVKVTKVRAAIYSSWLKFGTPVVPDIPAAKERQYKVRSVDAYQAGSPGLGKRS